LQNRPEGFHLKETIANTGLVKYALIMLMWGCCRDGSKGRTAPAQIKVSFRSKSGVLRKGGLRKIIFIFNPIWTHSLLLLSNFLLFGCRAPLLDTFGRLTSFSYKEQSLINNFAMASTARTFARAAVNSTHATSAFKTTARKTAFTLPRQAFRQQSRRGYASEPTKSSSGLYIGIGALALGGAGYYLYTKGNGSLLSGSASETSGLFTPKFEDYQKVYNEIAARLEEKDDYDDGSYGPVLVRLAWHCSGTFDKETGTGGSNGATMRFAPEGDHGANAGLKAARDFLEPIKREFSFLQLYFKHANFCDREIPLDLLLRSVDSQRGCRHPRNARSCYSIPTWKNR
jgi:hypothetical protein